MPKDYIPSIPSNEDTGRYKAVYRGTKTTDVGAMSVEQTVAEGG